MPPATEVIDRAARGLSRRRLLTRGATAGGLMLGARAIQARPLEQRLELRPQVAGTVDPNGEATRQWRLFHTRFTTPDGRVIDTGNGGVSHSEGQGIGMLSAAMFGDQASFDLLWGWTTEHLKRGTDALHSWRFRPNTATPVDDPNNATDGDLLIGLALFTAADRWSDATYRAAGRRLARDVLSGLIRHTAGGIVLMPALDGFDSHDQLVLNPSYYVFPALRRFAAEVPDPAWAALWSDGLTLLRGARFGRWQLPPDWINLSANGDLSLPYRWPTRYSFDAVRLPLYLCWAGLHGEPAVEAIHAFWSPMGAASPAWADLTSNGLAPYSLTVGMEAIRRFVQASLGPPGTVVTLPSVAQAPDYYSGALIMLSEVASAVCRGCYPEAT